ncbi:MAG: cyclic beta 1-2 glucan synthetase, partial [Herminiimonas sp.]|nr:cyclic beta 1-2 glucan synthetase [Herminiimonas sp.]
GPIVAIGCAVALEPGQSAWLDWVTGIAPTPTACLALMDQFRQPEQIDLVLQSAPQQAGGSDGAADALAQLAASLLYANNTWRADAAVVAANRLGQPALWAHAISGDLPILLLRVGRTDGLLLARQIITAHADWRWHGLAVDLVIVCAGSQPATLAAQLRELAAQCGQATRLDQPGGIVLLQSDAVSPADDRLLQSVARVLLDDADGPLSQQVADRAARVLKLAGTAASPVATWQPAPSDSRETTPDLTPAAGLEFFNGTGGFSADGREYVITLQSGQSTPAPWVNVLANPEFGTLVSESGSAASWSENAQAFRLTPWNNDAVSDPNTEACYLRDEESGHYWSATASPARGCGTYVTRHGFGYSSFSHSEDGIDSELCVFVAIDAPVKYTRLTLHNRSGRARHLSATGYLEWVLGDEPEKTRMQVVTEHDAGRAAIFASNAYNTDFGDRTAFFAGEPGAECSISGDRATFIGRNGSLQAPLAMAQPLLAGGCGATLDPCAAIRVPFTLDDGASRVLVFRLGAARSAAAARTLADDTDSPAAAQAALDKVREFWDRTLGTVQVKTPDRRFDIMTNGWLVYQTLACRLWARNAFYQSSGAFGFR